MSTNQEPKISDRTFECFTCKKHGVPGVQVYLKGKTSQGFPVRIEVDKVTPHRHRNSKESTNIVPQNQESFPAPKIEALLKGIHVKLDAIMSAVNAPPTEDPRDYEYEGNEYPNGISQ